MRRVPPQPLEVVHTSININDLNITFNQALSRDLPTCGHGLACLQARDELITHYVEMRRSGASRKTVTATPRQLESLIRLSEVRSQLSNSATMLFSEPDVHVHQPHHLGYLMHKDGPDNPLLTLW